MNLVGKIFVFLVFCMSLVFTAFSVMIYATHVNWREEVLRETVGGPNNTVGWKQALANEKQRNVFLQSQTRALNDTIATEKAIKRQQIAKLEGELVLMTKQRDDLVASYVEKAGELSAAVAEVAIEQTVQENLRATNESVRGDIKKARSVIDDQFADLKTLTDQNHQALGEGMRLQERASQLETQLAAAERVLAAHDLDRHDSLIGIPPPVGGVVTMVKKYKDDIFVEVTIGSDDGLRKGHRLEVYRAGTYLGQVEIVRTTPDRAVGKVDRRVQQGPIRASDRVETRRNLKLTAG